MVVIVSTLCLIAVIAMYVQERRKKVKFTPLFAFALPYTLIMLVVSVMDLLGIYNVTKMSVYIPIISLVIFLLFWLVGKFVFAKSGNRCKKNSSSLRPLLKITNRLLIVGLICIAIHMVWTFYNLGGHGISSAEIRKAYSSGFFSHLVNLISVLFLVNFAEKRTDKLQIFLKVLGMLWIAVLLIIMSKYTVLMYAVTVLIIMTMVYPKQFTPGKVMLYIFVIAGLFILTYIIRDILEGNNIQYSFIFRHFYYYLTGGFYAFSEVVVNVEARLPTVGWGIIFAPIINIFRLLTGKEFTSSTSAFIDLDLPFEYSRTNVFTIPGALYVEVGMLGMLFCILLIGLLSYAVYRLYINSSNKVSFVLFSYSNAILFFSFFNCFYGMANVWEMFGLMAAMYVLNYVILRKKRKRSYLRT